MPRKDSNPTFFDYSQRFLLNKIAHWASLASPYQRHRLGSLLRFLAQDALKIRARYVQSTLQDCLDLSEHQALKLGRRVYTSFFENALEMASMHLLTHDQLEGRLLPHGLHHLKNALSFGKGVILISGHYGLWELIPPWLVLNKIPVTVVVRRQNNILVDNWMENMRRKHGVQTTDSGFSLREILRTLRKGHCLGLMSDQDNGDRGVFVKFFGKWASAPVGPAQISMKTGAPLVPLMAHRSGGNQPHHFEIHSPIFPGQFSNSENGRQAMTQAYTDVLEQWIRNRPEQWLWLHRRWKTQPQINLK